MPRYGLDLLGISLDLSLSRSEVQMGTLNPGTPSVRDSGVFKDILGNLCVVFLGLCSFLFSCFKGRPRLFFLSYSCRPTARAWPPPRLRTGARREEGVVERL